MRWIVGASIQLRVLVVVIAVLIMVFGATQLRQMPVDVLPEFSPPYVEIQTESLGLSAEEVEQLITVPMEQDLLNGLPWLQSIRSESVPGLSSVVLLFQPGTDLMRARQMVSERMTQAVIAPQPSWEQQCHRRRGRHPHHRLQGGVAIAPEDELDLQGGLEARQIARAGRVDGHQIRSHRDHSRGSRVSHDRPVAFHRHDGIHNGEVRTKRGVEIDDGIVDAVEVQDVLRPAVHGAGHDPKHVLHARRHRGPVMCLQFRHRDDEVGTQEVSRESQAIEACEPAAQ